MKSKLSKSDTKKPSLSKSILLDKDERMNLSMIGGENKYLGDLGKFETE